jgi:hypothetical protein
MPMNVEIPENSLSVAAMLALAIIVAGGCSNSGQFETSRVSGTVTLDGKLVQGGHVSFIPERGRSANGVIGSDGTFELTTYSPKDGATIGKHRVAVFVTDGKASELDSDVASLAPARYQSAETSGITWDVKSGEDNQVQLQLKGK